jgi:hypothetical protein
MIIDDLDAFRRTSTPAEADSPLIIYPDTVLTLPVPAQRLKPLSWNYRHILQPLGVVQHSKLAPCHRFNVAESAALLAVKKLLCLLAAEGSYQHGQYTTVTVKRSTINGTSPTFTGMNAASGTVSSAGGLRLLTRSR